MFENKEEKAEVVAQERDFAMKRELYRENIMTQAGASDNQVSLDHQNERSELIKWQQNLSDEVERLKHQLRSESSVNGAWKPCEGIVGYGVDKDGNTVAIEGIVRPLMNELGIQMVDTTISPLVSRNMMNTNLKEKTIYKILRRTMKTVVDNMVNNYDVYDAEFANYDHIKDLVWNTILPAPFRALNNGERRYGGGMIKVIEAHNLGGAQFNQRKKMFGIF